MADRAIVAEGLVKRFGDVVALDGVSIEVPAGTVLGLLGPNGAGKTTAIRILTTILTPDEGRASVLGYDVVHHPHAVRSSIGLAGQYAAVDENLTARENLRLIGKLTHQPKSTLGPRADELLERFDLASADRPVKTYSGGMRRRLDLAAALVHRPPVLFLDEPTTGLDPAGRNDLWAVIGGLVADGTTLLLTTQYLEEAERLADRIVVIDHGRVIAEGTAGELKSTVGGDVLELTIADPKRTAEAAQILERATGHQPASDPHAGHVSAAVDNGGAAAVAVLRRLDKAGVVVSELAVRRPTLDDVFLELTGHKAEDAPTPQNGAGFERATEKRERATPTKKYVIKTPDGSRIEVEGVETDERGRLVATTVDGKKLVVRQDAGRKG